LLADFLAQVPREDENVVGPSLGQVFRRIDRNMGAGQEPALLDRAPVDRVGEQVRPDAAVVQERVALARGAVSGHRAALAGRGEQEAEQVALDLENRGREALMTGHRVQARGLLSGQHRLHLLGRLAAVLLRPGIDP
jgi:hypothetical protein